MSVFSKSFIKWIKNSSEIFILRSPSENKKVDYIKKLNNIGFNKFYDKEDKIESIEQYISDSYKHVFIDAKTMNAEDVKQYIELAKMHFFMAICPDLGDSDSTKSSKIAKGEGDTLSGDNTDLSVYFSGWFLSDLDQIRLHKKGRRCFKTMIGIEAIGSQLRKKTGTEDLKQYYPKQKKRLHVTAKFLGRCPDKQYEAAVSGFLCSISEVTVTGLLLTPRTFSCHVVLPEADRKLFDDQDENNFYLKPHITLAVGGDTAPVQSGPDEIEVQTLIEKHVKPEASYDTEYGRVDDYGECRFYVTLTEPESLSVLFNFMY